ncbi:MAG: fatty acid desaturase, partial [Candidatus Liptonbacteria bacterium]|nr:fatty acid desaturase [Candidatus Liptonbacteria bacterium]
EVASFVTTVYLHRGAAHRAVVFHPAVGMLMNLVLWLTTGIRRDQWVAVHLKHHAHPDAAGDPHSPHLLGLWRVQLGNVFLYRNALRSPSIMQYARHIRLTWAERKIFRSAKVGLACGIGLLCLVFGLWRGLLIAGVHTLLYVFCLNNLINGWCHVRGYKNFPDVVAFNNRLVAWLTAGEGLHNNHHKEPGNPSLRRHQPAGRFGEVDLGLLLIQCLRVLRLADVKRAQQTPD